MLFRRTGGISGAAYALWLAELAEALREARGLAAELAAEGRMDELAELQARIDGARMGVAALTQSRISTPVQQLDPKWTEITPWQRSRSVDLDSNRDVAAAGEWLEEGLQ